MKIIKQCKTLVLFQHNHSRSECLPLVKNVLFPTYSFPVFESGNLSRFQFGCGRCFPVLCSLMRFFDCGTQQTICHLAWLTSIWFVIHRICLSISFWYQRTHIRIYQNKITIYASKKITKTKEGNEKVFERSNISNYDIHGDCIFLNKPPKTPTIMIDDKTMSCHNWAWIWTVHFNSSQQKAAGCSSQTFNIWLSFSKRIY